MEGRSKVMENGFCKGTGPYQWEAKIEGRGKRD